MKAFHAKKETVSLHKSRMDHFASFSAEKKIVIFSKNLQCVTE